MNTLYLQPTDILFFRDGRPMSGSLTGHGAAWPLPTVLNAALHAALWRSNIASHPHRSGRSGKLDGSERDRKFGSLFSAGPFPEYEGTWYFPRPADAQKPGSTEITLVPRQRPAESNLPGPLTHVLANTQPPSKDKPETWISQTAFESYLHGKIAQAGDSHFVRDTDFCDAEHAIGIGIDPETATQNGEQFYTANYLRLRPGWRLGCLTEAKDKEHQGGDITAMLFDEDHNIVVGGQQRSCSATLYFNVVKGLPHASSVSGTLIKWVLLTPAIFPRIGDHPGGHLPSWVNHLTGRVELLDGPGKNAAARRKVPAGKPIGARLVAALCGKPLPVTGYALPHEAAGSQGGAKPTHLAVPAGAVYYFEADSPEDAQKLADALNWHGALEVSAVRNPQSAMIKNRRSTLMGEKGFGLGVCGTWEFHQVTS